MDTNQLFQDFPRDESYTGRCEVVLAEPTGRVGGSATVSAKLNSRAEAAVSIEEFEAPPEYNNNLLAFLNASPPRKSGTKIVIPIKASGTDRRVVSFTLETSDGILSASSGIVIAPELVGVVESIRLPISRRGNMSLLHSRARGAEKTRLSPNCH
jgi:hypothetical protein